MKKTLTLEVLSLFPESFKSFLESSIVARAIDKGLVAVNTDDIRDYSRDKHRKTDDYPYGGFAGMVASPQPIWDAISTKISEKPAPVIYFSRKADNSIKTYSIAMPKKSALSYFVDITKR